MYCQENALRGVLFTTHALATPTAAVLPTESIKTVIVTRVFTDTLLNVAHLCSCHCY